MQESQWTIDTLKEHLTDKIISNDKYINDKIESNKQLSEQKFKSLDDATKKVEQAAQQLAVKNNEFRAALDDASKINIARTEVMQMNKSQDEKIESVKVDLSKTIEEIKKEISGLRESRSQGMGKDENKVHNKDQNNWVIGIAIGVIIAVVQIVLHFNPVK